MSEELLSPFFLSMKLAFFTTLILLVLAVPITYFISFYTFRFKPIFKAIVSLPLVLPPTVLGYYLLIAFQPQFFGVRLAFSFVGLVVGAVIFSLPFMVNPLISGIENLPHTYIEVARTLGKSKLYCFVNVLLPNIKPHILNGIAMTFAHTVGEFGVVLMIGGSIPNETKVASVAIYQELEALHYENANFYASILLIFTFLVLLFIHISQKKQNK
jgi:molybdate transport system permease protein